MASIKCPTCKEKYFDWNADRHECGHRFFVHMPEHYDAPSNCKIYEREWREQYGRDAAEAAERAWRKEIESSGEYEESEELVVVAIGGNPEIDGVDGVNVILKCYTAQSYVMYHYRAEDAHESPSWTLETGDSDESNESCDEETNEELCVV